MAESMMSNGHLLGRDELMGEIREHDYIARRLARRLGVDARRLDDVLRGARQRAATSMRALHDLPVAESSVRAFVLSAVREVATETGR